MMSNKNNSDIYNAFQVKKSHLAWFRSDLVYLAKYYFPGYIKKLQLFTVIIRNSVICWFYALAMKINANRIFNNALTIFPTKSIYQWCTCYSVNQRIILFTFAIISFGAFWMPRISAIWIRITSNCRESLNNF